ncbi:MAG: 4Fe-4S dicluster domain-containing protein [Vibrio sp.]
MSDVILYDAVDCINCFACMTACSSENRLREKRKTHQDIAVSMNSEGSDTYYLTPVSHEIGEFPNARTIVGFHHCNHCENAPCLENCPSHAIERRPGGQVVINEAACVGCQTCVDVCPYNVPHYSPQTNKASKCIGCYDRVENGLPQACVSACPTGALISGTREEMLEEGRKRRQHYQDTLKQDIVLYGDEAPNDTVGKLNWLTIAPKEYSEQYLIPENPKEVGMQIRSVAKDVSGIGVGVTAGALALHGLFYFSQRKKQVQEAELKESQKQEEK